MQHLIDRYGINCPLDFLIITLAIVCESIKLVVPAGFHEAEGVGS